MKKTNKREASEDKEKDLPNFITIMAPKPVKKKDIIENVNGAILFSTYYSNIASVHTSRSPSKERTIYKCSSMKRVDYSSTTRSHLKSKYNQLRLIRILLQEQIHLIK